MLLSCQVCLQWPTLGSSTILTVLLFYDVFYCSSVALLLDFSVVVLWDSVAALALEYRVVL